MIINKKMTVSFSLQADLLNVTLVTWTRNNEEYASTKPQATQRSHCFQMKENVILHEQRKEG